MDTKLPYRYTKTELEQLLDSLTVLIDTRENKNEHITDYFNQFDINYKSKKLDYGDYSFMLPEAPKLGIAKDIYFTDQVVVERKANLNELSGNLAQERQRFENELIRANNCRFILLIEDGQGYENIVNHNYRTKYKPKSYLGSLLAFQHRYNLDIQFIDPDYSGQFIRYEFHYYLREFLK